MTAAPEQPTPAWRRWFWHLAIPLLASLGIHALITAGLALKTLTVRLFSESPSFAVSLVEPAREIPDELQWPVRESFSVDDVLTAQADQPDPFDYAPADELAKAVRDLPISTAGESDPGGFGVGDLGRSGVIGLGGGAGEGGGAGAGPGFGSGAMIADAKVWDLKARGTRFAYVVDFSGSIVVAEGDLKRELKRSIGRLTPRQEFNVYLFHSSKARRRYIVDAFRPQMQPADATVKRAFFDWLAPKEPWGTTKPLDAMRRALSQQPSAVFFFSDGYFDDAIVDEILKLNRTVGAQIHCLVFDELLLQDDRSNPRLTDGARRLQRLSDLTKGQCKVVTGADLR